MVTAANRITPSLKGGLVFPLLFLAVVVSSTSLVMAQSPGTFTPTGSMVTGRVGHTATLLPNGKVLIAGGQSPPAFAGGQSPPALADSQLYDPSSGTFTPTGSLTAARFRHTATLLPNGKVLIAGGSSDPRISAELYDPATGTFTATGDMTTSGGTATLLSNGKVLITNGSGDASAELYDSSSGAFSRTGNPTTRGAHIATLLPNGKVLIVPSDEGADLSAELYDPGTGTFSRTDWRNIYTMVAATVNLLASGNVLVTLNIQECDSGSRTAELFDPSSGTFSATGDMTYGICRPTGTLLPNGTVLVANGWFTPSGNAQIYDPGSGKFSPTGDMIASRHDHTSTLLKDGRVLVAGGYGNVPNIMTSSPPLLTGAELYNPVSLRPAPVLLSLSGDGGGQGAIQHADTYLVVTADNPAVAGEIVVIYCVGLVDGSVIPPQVAIGGSMAEVLWFGKTPGYVGLNQINVRVPSGLAPGPAVSVRLNYLGLPSNEVTLGVR